MSLLDDCPAPTTDSEIVYVGPTYTFDFSVYPTPPYIYEVAFFPDCCNVCSACCGLATLPDTLYWFIPGSGTNGTLVRSSPTSLEWVDPHPAHFTNCDDAVPNVFTLTCNSDPSSGSPLGWIVNPEASSKGPVGVGLQPEICNPFCMFLTAPGSTFCETGVSYAFIICTTSDCNTTCGASPPGPPPPPPPDFYCGPYGCEFEGTFGCLACVSVAGGSTPPDGYHSGPWDSNSECVAACDINPPAWCCTIQYFDADGHEVVRPLRPGGVTPPSRGCGQGLGKIGGSLAVEDLNNGGDVVPLPPGIVSVVVTIIDGAFENLGDCEANCISCGGAEETGRGPCDCEPAAWCLQWQDYDASDTAVGTPYGGGCINDITTPPTYMVGEVDPTHFDPAVGAAGNITYRKRTFLSGPWLTLAECRKSCYPMSGTGISGFSDPCVRADWYCATPIVGGTQSVPVYGMPICIPVPVGAVGPPTSLAGPFASKSLCEANPCPPPSGMDMEARPRGAFGAQGATSSDKMSVGAQRRFVAGRAPAKPAVSLALLDMGAGLPCSLRSTMPTGDMEFCAGCLGKRREIPLFGCEKFEWCTPHTQAADSSVKCCRTCKFREYDPEPVRVAVEHAAGGIGDGLQLLGVVSKFRRDNPGTLVDLFVGPLAVPFVSLFEGWDSVSVSAAIHCEDTGTARRQANLGYHWNESHGRPMNRWDLYAANIGAEGYELPTLRDPEAVREAGADLAGAMVLAPLSTDPDRNWSIDKWLEIEARLIKVGYTVVILHGGPNGTADLDRFAGTKLINESPERVAGVLLNCTMFAGNDSGLAHLAGSLGVPATVVGAGPLDKVFGCYPSVRFVRCESV